MHVAVAAARLEIVEFLVQFPEVDLYAENRSGETPLQIAAKMCSLSPSKTIEEKEGRARLALLIPKLIEIYEGRLWSTQFKRVLSIVYQALPVLTSSLSNYGIAAYLRLSSLPELFCCRRQNAQVCLEVARETTAKPIEQASLRCFAEPKEERSFANVNLEICPFVTSNVVSHALAFETNMAPWLKSQNYKVYVAGSFNLDPALANDFDLLIFGRPGQKAREVCDEVYNMFLSLKDQSMVQDSKLYFVEKIEGYNQVKLYFTANFTQSMIDITCYDHDASVAANAESRLASFKCVLVDFFTKKRIASEAVARSIADKQLYFVGDATIGPSLKDLKYLSRSIDLALRIGYKIDVLSFPKEVQDRYPALTYEAQFYKAALFFNARYVEETSSSISYP